MTTSNVYFNGASVADDIHVGEKYSRQYADFVPIVQLFLGKKDEKIMEKVKLFNEGLCVVVRFGTHNISANLSCKSL